ncbi:MAG: aromatic ring-hydroxylating dioxygenase subunit alpha [Candidatus Gracilibacteria bacterium]|nr:aromatic ring-hydroxylating dioxygenase subunit alpha [Candidatus Gracilibacteria bacterium]
MIYNQWYVILESKELKKSKPLKITRFSENLSLRRDENGKVGCVADKCCHRGVSLSCGKVVDGEIQCPFHGFTFDKTGACTHIPANGKNTPVPKTMRVKSYKTFEDFGFIWVWWGDIDEIKEEPFFFKELGDFSYSTLKDHWNVHYSRAIENQLDVVHLPFVHKTTIGRGNKTLVNGPVVEREGELLIFYVNNILDDGKTKPLKPEEIKNYKKLFHLQFHYPNIWQNFISDKIRIFAAFVPVDEENSIIYIRYYQKVVTSPFLKQLVNYIGKVSSLIILRQDKRVVETQLPKKSSLKSDEHIIMGDKPIVEYRLHRQELIDKKTRN